jgi:hypothetical protein
MGQLILPANRAEFVDNILGLDNPEHYTCYIEAYGLGHSILILKIENMTIASDTFYLFMELAYFSTLPLAWQGANFYLLGSHQLRQMQKEYWNIPWPETIDMGTLSYFVFNVKIGSFVKAVHCQYMKKYMSKNDMGLLEDLS